MSTTPLTPDQWIKALTAEGVKMNAPYSGWRTHGRDDETGKTFGPVNGVTIHHTVGSNSLALCYNGTSSLPGPLCHGHLPKTGTVNMISAHRANHAGTFAQNAHNAVLAESPVHPYPDSAEPVDGNDKYYGLEIENRGDGSDPYPMVQYVAAVKWATAICRFHGWTENSVIGHKEGTRRKIDPKGPVQGGALFTMDRFRTHVKQALALPAGVWPNQEEDMALSVDDVKKIFGTDGFLKSGDGSTTNEFWTAGSFLTETYKLARDAKAEGKAARLEAVAASGHVLDVGEQVARLEAKVDALQTGGVDLDALAVKVADELYRRMQS